MPADPPNPTDLPSLLQVAETAIIFTLVRRDFWF